MCATAADGLQWGTITSEPGSGGDMLRTKSLAEPDDADGPIPGASYRVTGDKHFGSGSGVTSFMVTTAVPAGEEAPTIFVLDVRDRPWDGSAGYAPDRRVGRRRHGGDAEPRHASRVVPGDAHRRGTAPCRISPRPPGR